MEEGRNCEPEVLEAVLPPNYTRTKQTLGFGHGRKWMKAYIYIYIYFFFSPHQLAQPVISLGCIKPQIIL